MGRTIRIATRDSQLAVWQATLVMDQLKAAGYHAELVYIKSEGDINLTTPLYEMGVQGIFTRSLDIALLEKRVDIAVHSMKDVPVAMAKGLMQVAVLERGSYKDLLVTREDAFEELQMLGTSTDDQKNNKTLTIATSSIRRKAQWLYHYPGTTIDNLRGNVNTRMQKLANSNWDGAIFAAAGLERIGLRPPHSLELDWMLPAPAQGAIVVVSRIGDEEMRDACVDLNHEATAICVKLERQFLHALEGGCSTPISALAQMANDTVLFKGNITAVDGCRSTNVEIKKGVDELEHIVPEALGHFTEEELQKYL